MPVRIYLCEIVHNPTGGMLGLGQSRAAFHDALPGRQYTVIEDLRAVLPATTGKLLVAADVTDADHALAIADVRIQRLPFETAAGNSIGVLGTLADIPGAKRTALLSAMENLHIPTDDIDTTWTVKRVLARAVRRLRLRRILSADDLATGLDTLVSALPLATRQAINTKLTALGFNTAGLGGTNTVRSALKALVAQANAALVSEYD
jgi:hypothetical protein